jgi:hypothetical protein
MSDVMTVRGARKGGTLSRLTWTLTTEVGPRRAPIQPRVARVGALDHRPAAEFPACEINKPHDAYRRAACRGSGVLPGDGEGRSPGSPA